ncbi:aminoglycoside phosphotransferase family protein [Pseudoclavibacter sp. RFBG4]|nr:aminoglycoside phosphotransferase family protein [Pseudoclavibacter sp. RFBG4]
MTSPATRPPRNGLARASPLAKHAFASSWQSWRMHDTSYASPTSAAVERAAEAALEAAGRRSSPSTWTLVEHGSANVVILTEDAAVRVARSDPAAIEVRRAQRLVDALPALPFAVPRSLGPAVEVNGVTAIAQVRIAGSPHEPGSGDPSALAGLLDAVRSVPILSLSPHLSVPRAFMGGSTWHQRMRRDVIPLLDRHVQEEASRRVDSLADLPPAARTLTHGDLAGTNVLWQDGKVTGVLDWDLASADDAAEDIASLASWHGWAGVTAFASPDELHRARVFAATHVLQPIAFSLIQGRPAAEVERAVERANKRLAASPAVTA